MQAKPAIDILVFSPHPDDETIACGGSISKAIKENKKVKIVFLTNGDAYPESASIWLKKKAERLVPQDYIVFGKERKKEALGAVKTLGIGEKDAIFLNYPDNKLFSLWMQEELPGKKLYSKRNLLNDIKKILSDYQPKKIYLPHPADNHKDHQATTLFVYLVLKELRNADKSNSWLDSLEPSYYLVHRDANDNLFQLPARSEEIVDFKQQKLKALSQYHTQVTSDKEFLDSFIKDNELFWDVPKDKTIYLNNLEAEWQRIAEYMHSKGYNVNFSPVVDVADNIENINHPLVKKQRMYSQAPQVVSELASAIISGMIKGRIIPVLKHFPGLGSVYDDTHLMLPKANIANTELHQRDLLPFRSLIKKYPDIWIMIDHAIYSGLSDKPASLSYEIQTKLLREKLGFKGIIVADELLGMRAIKEYALREAIKEPYIGKIVARAFEAGADIAVIYPPSGNTERVISDIIESVKEAVKKGCLSQKSIDESVSRILKEKEKIFGRQLVYLVKKMSFEEKIGQKLIFDYHNDIGIFGKYNIGGVYLHDHNDVDKTQKDIKIPLFIIGQHEGGIISQYTINSRSAYVIGKEFEVLVKRDKADVEGNMRLLCLAAHPDDEDGQALVYFKERFGYQTYILLATRGEAGENKTGNALYKELGFLRSEEAEKAASILGVKKVYYLGKNDFGYCSAIEEAFKRWNREDTLKRLVYFYRLIRPHIIITRHNKFDDEDHCQHRALITLAEEAFDLAGNPDVYPEMIKEGLLPWQPLKFYQRAGNNTTLDEVVISSKEKVGLAGKSINEIAFEALKQHRSQGDWQWLKSDNDRPRRIVYQLIKSKVASKEEISFFDGRKIGPSGIPGVKIAKDLKIGLVEKNNNTLFVALKTLGYDFKSLDERSIQKGDLSQFDTVILGQEVCGSFPAAIQSNNRLLEFVKNGGNLIIFAQYPRREALFPYAPYPLQISFSPISNENAPVAILKPEHPLFNFPNKIILSDFAGWSQERGLYFPVEYSNEYNELIGCLSDRGKQIMGGYLVARYGKGSYIYTGYSWYRQFIEFHPGAYKNLSNMLAYSYAKK